MRHQAAARTHSWFSLAANERLGARAYRFVFDWFLLLPLGAAIAIVWANTAEEGYVRFAQQLRPAVNEIGMAFFLALMAHEVMEALMPGGALSTWRRWGMSLVAAAGGALGAAFVFLRYAYWSEDYVLPSAWPAACAIDIAAGYYLLRAIGLSGAAAPFFLVSAIVADAAALLVMALWQPFSEGQLVGAVLLCAAVGLAAIIRRLKVESFGPYLLLCGPLSWAGFYSAEVHPALALLPIVPFLPRKPRTIDLFADPGGHDIVHREERRWTVVVQLVLFLFGLVNAGVVLRGYEYTGTWAMLAAAMIGRPLCMLGAVALGLAAGLHLPRRVGWRELVVIAMATASGFTFSLFVAVGLLPVGPMLAQIKIGALGTVAGALGAVALARSLHVGRFAR